MNINQIMLTLLSNLQLKCLLIIHKGILTRSFANRLTAYAPTAKSFRAIQHTSRCVINIHERSLFHSRTRRFATREAAGDLSRTEIAMD